MTTTTPPTSTDDAPVGPGSASAALSGRADTVRTGRADTVRTDGAYTLRTDGADTVRTDPTDATPADPSATAGPATSEPRWLDESESTLWRAFLKMRRELDRVVEAQLLRDSGLSTADFAVLVPLSESATGRLRARDLGAEAGWDRSRLSHQLRRMEQRGLVERTECETDGRGTFVSLTAQGRTAIEGAAPGHVATVRAHLIDDLTAEELAVFTTIAQRVIARTADA